MKKKLLIGLACFAVIAAAVTVTVSTINANTPLLSALMLENLQALSDEEGRVFYHEIEKKLGEDAFSAFENFYYENEFLSSF